MSHLQAIKEADDPINATNTYFNQNEALTLDTRDTSDSDRVVDGVHTSEELSSLEAEGIEHKQQKSATEEHPRIYEIRVISQVSLTVLCCIVVSRCVVL